MKAPWLLALTVASAVLATAQQDDPEEVQVIEAGEGVGAAQPGSVKLSGLSALNSVQQRQLRGARRLEEAAKAGAPPPPSAASPPGLAPPTASSVQEDKAKKETASSAKGDKAKKEKAERHADRPKRPPKAGHGMPTWLLVLLCFLAVFLPVGVVLLMVAYKRRQDAAAGSQAGGAASGAVATQDPDDDEPDSPRHDPYASAFAAQDDDEEPDSPRPDPYASSFAVR